MGNVLGIIGVIALFWVALLALTPTDDCDKSWWKRCGANVVIDHATGCQYLANSKGIVRREGFPCTGASHD